MKLFLILWLFVDQYNYMLSMFYTCCVIFNNEVNLHCFQTRSTINNKYILQQDRPSTTSISSNKIDHQQQIYPPTRSTINNKYIFQHDRLSTTSISSNTIDHQQVYPPARSTINNNHILQHDRSLTTSISSNTIDHQQQVYPPTR